MSENDEFKKYEYCSHLIKEGLYVEALQQAELISTSGYRAALFIDAGFALAKPSIIRNGISLFDKLINSSESSDFPKYVLLYNIANGYSSLFTLKRKKGKKTVPPNDKDLRLAKLRYREAIEILPSKSGKFAALVHINYGNCLSQLGRFAETIEYYELALKADPTNGIAAGNLGIELLHVAGIAGRFTHEYLAQAHDMLTRALGETMLLNSGSLQAINSFKAYHEYLTGLFKSHKEPIVVPQPVQLIKKKQAKNQYVQFCIDNGLFLNAWVGDPLLSPGITDDISYGPIVTTLDDNFLVPELLRILNEIKESFATARYLFFLSQQPNRTLDDVSSMTLYFDNLDYDINGVYTGLCKTAYVRAFDILDKIARIVNVYFTIGNRMTSFWNTFIEKQSHGKEHTIFFATRSEIVKTENYGLYALADICVDYFEREHVDLFTIDARRNKITHDYLPVRDFMMSDEINGVTINDFIKQTRDVLHLTKLAILYAVNSVNIAELKKDTSGKISSMMYYANPGRQFVS